MPNSPSRSTDTDAVGCRFSRSRISLTAIRMSLSVSHSAGPVGASVIRGTLHAASHNESSGVSAMFARARASSRNRSASEPMPLNRPTFWVTPRWNSLKSFASPPSLNTHRSSSSASRSTPLTAPAAVARSTSPAPAG